MNGKNLDKHWLAVELKKARQLVADGWHRPPYIFSRNYMEIYFNKISELKTMVRKQVMWSQSADLHEVKPGSKVLVEGWPSFTDWLLRWQHQKI